MILFKAAHSILHTDNEVLIFNFKDKKFANIVEYRACQLLGAEYRTNCSCHPLNPSTIVVNAASGALEFLIEECCCEPFRRTLEDIILSNKNRAW